MFINPRFSNQVCDILSKNMNYIQQKFGVTRIGLFGSYDRGEQSSKSDVDILVDFLLGEATFDNFMQLEYFLEELLSKRVDILPMMESVNI